jgi:Gluconate 2-dehydrogenase subunit 3
MPDESTLRDSTIDRREAIRRVTTILGGVALVGGGSLMAACERARTAPGDSAAAVAAGPFTAADVALLDEIADTILPDTKTPGAKAAKTGAFMALMVTDGYDAREQKLFRDGMQKLDAASQKANGKGFVASTPAQRTALLQTLDRAAKAHGDAVQAARKARSGTTATAAPAPTAAPSKPATTAQPDQRAQNATATPDAGAPGEITADSPTHYFRMMKELALLGYFTSEIGYTQAMRYVESPGRFDPCAPYTPGEKAWAAHA